MPAIAEIRLRKDNVDARLRDRGWAVADLARATGLAESTWHRLFAGKIPLTAKTAAGLLDALRGDDPSAVSWDDLFELLGRDDAAPPAEATS